MRYIRGSLLGPVLGRSEKRRETDARSSGKKAPRP
jgi:hypothetical protein